MPIQLFVFQLSGHRLKLFLLFTKHIAMKKKSLVFFTAQFYSFNGCDATF